jgi:acyl dehydratase
MAHPLQVEQLTPRVTVTESHVQTYAGLTGDFSELHVDVC